ncbi:hypothetical protein DYH10_00690 [Candidatus Saccharibacteria bacterium CPR2]|nr:hypothetical protein [Candidatus Saccharibacteria bacterium CPR2]
MRINYYDQYSANDLALVSVLIYLGFAVERVEKDVKGKATFYFYRNSELDQAVQEYWSGDISVEPRSYFDAIKRTKTRIYSET